MLTTKPKDPQMPDFGTTRICLLALRQKMYCSLIETKPNRNLGH